MLTKKMLMGEVRAFELSRIEKNDINYSLVELLENTGMTKAKAMSGQDVIELP